MNKVEVKKRIPPLDNESYKGERIIDCIMRMLNNYWLVLKNGEEVFWWDKNYRYDIKSP